MKEAATEVSVTFGEWLRARRTEQGLSLRALAQEIGVHFAYLSQLERGVETPSEAVTYKLADYFGHPAPDELLLMAGRIPSSIKQALLYNPAGSQAILRHYVKGESEMSNEIMVAQWKEEAKRQWMVHVTDSILALQELGEDVSELQSLQREGQKYLNAAEYGLLWRQIALIRHKMRQRRGRVPLAVQHGADDHLLQCLTSGEEPERPSSWDGLHAAAANWPEKEVTTAEVTWPTGLSLEVYQDKTYAGWLGKIIGGALGTPVEGWSKEKIEQEHGEITGYLREPDTYNDDTTFQLAFISAMERAGGDATSEQLGLEWVERIPMACTAEEIAILNMRQGIFPPLSAWLDNPYAEWVGAQMRGEVCGFVAPGAPRRAATLAWRDARISHVREGLYGEVFNAVMTSLAYTHRGDLESLIQESLTYVPQRSLFAQAVQDTVEACSTSATWQEAWEKIVPRWVTPYHWVHTLSNIPAIIIGLWFGWGDFGQNHPNHDSVRPGYGLQRGTGRSHSGRFAGNGRHRPGLA